jgi:hypothetical protein
MQDSSAFQFIAIDTIHESTTNPRRTFDEAKLYELAESIMHNGMIQPITVRPNNQGFEIVAEAFTQERISASHANLIARLPQESQAEAFEQCWRKDWQDKEPHLLPAKHLAAWIQDNLYLSLADAPSTVKTQPSTPRRERALPAPVAADTTRLYSATFRATSLDSTCYHSKVEAFLDREIAAHPGLVQIENGCPSPPHHPA